MSKYRFRLETLMRIREGTRDECRQQLAQAIKAEQVIENRINEINEQYQQSRLQAQGECRPGAVNVDQLLDIHRYELVLQAEQKQLIQQGEAVANEIDNRRTILVEADREVRVLEKLRDKQQTQHDLEERRLEIRDLDEAAGRCRVGEEI